MLIKSFIISKTKTSLTKNLKLIKIQKCTIMRVINAAAKQSAVNKINHSAFHSSKYVTHAVHTPDPTTNSAESFNENPVHVLYRKKKSVVMQHAELAEQCCDLENCSIYSCKELCSTPVGKPKAVGHFTHSEEKGDIEISQTDLEGENRSQYIKTHKIPYDIESQSKDPVGDQQKTQKLNADFEDLDNHGSI